jgi:hypothetical protein
VTAGCSAVGGVDGYDIIAYELMCNNLGDMYDHCQDVYCAVARLLITLLLVWQVLEPWQVLPTP